MEYPEELALSIPPFLKQRLEDDCFWVLRRSKLVSLPAETSVTSLLRGYYQYSLINPPQDTNHSVGLLAEVLDGLKVYFDFTLSDHLLYSQEKAQFKHLCEEEGFGRATVVNKIPLAHINNKAVSNHTPTHSTPHTPHKHPSDVYGAEHFLRLFVRLPMFLSQAQLSTAHTHTIHTHIKDLLEYMVSQDGLFSDSHYHDNGTPHTNGLVDSDPMSTEQ